MEEYLTRLPDGRLTLDTAFTRLTGRSAVMLASVRGCEVGHRGGRGFVVGGGRRRRRVVVGWSGLVFEDGVEWWLGAGGGGESSGVVVGGDVDLVEEGLVEQAADVVGCLLVGMDDVLSRRCRSLNRDQWRSR